MHILLFFQCDICGRWTTGVVGVGQHAAFGASDNGPACAKCSMAHESEVMPVPMILRCAVPWS